MTEAEYLALPETMEKMELVDGFVVCEPSAGEPHQGILFRLALALGNWAESRTPPPTVRVAPLDIRFAADRILQPDLMLWCDPLVRPVAMPIVRIPDLCVEIVSSRPTYDRTTKRMLYAQARVMELWTVLPSRGVVERWSGPGLDVREETEGTLVTPLLPAFELDVASVFR